MKAVQLSLYDKVFTPTILSGSWEQAARSRNSIVLTEHTAKKMYSDIHLAIGKQIVLPKKQFSDGSVTYTVQAVIEDLPENTSMNFMRTIDLLTVNDEDGYESLPNQDILIHVIYAFLREGYTAEDLSQSSQSLVKHKLNIMTYNKGTVSILYSQTYLLLNVRHLALP